MYGLILMMLTLCMSGQAIGQCIFPSPFKSSTWHDSTRGTLVFNDTTVTGWTITLGTFSKTTLNVWQCVNNSDSSRLVMKASKSLTALGQVFYVYACLKVTEVKAGVSYTYVQLFRQEANAGQNRLKFSDKNTLSSSADICDDAVTIPTLDFHVLVKLGSEAAAAIKVPDRFLFSVDYDYIAGNGTILCSFTTDKFDMCTDTSALAIKYSSSTCTQQIAYSDGGALYCVATVKMTSYDCAVFLNRDAPITGSAKQFTCICSDGDVASVAPNNCTSDQSPTAFPTAADMTSVVGYKLDFKFVHVTCEAQDDEDNGAVCERMVPTTIVIGPIAVLILGCVRK